MDDSTRTEEYFEALRTDAGFTPLQIEQARKRHAVDAPLAAQDSFSDYFYHEVNNTLQMLLNLQQVELPWDPDAVTIARRRLQHVLQGPAWFKQEGELTKDQIRQFIEKAL